jgi:cholesterol transport system auxiliary component
VSSNRALKTIVVLASAFAIAGCVSLFPKSEPVQMYRFGVIEGPADAAPTGALTRAPTSFVGAAAGDQILTVIGNETAYLAEARWVAPAALLFDEAVERAFDARAGGPRLITRGDLTTSPISLQLDVDTFEARYLDGAEFAPTVVVSVRAVVLRTRDRVILGERVFASRQRAADNRVSLIVEAYDAAVKESLGAIADWAATTAASGG